jgi:hypothetical protein
MKSPLIRAAVLLAGLATAAPLLADNMMLEQTGLISGRQSFVVPLQVSAPGQMSVQLSDLGWAGQLSDLSFTLSGANGLVSADPQMMSVVSGGPAEAPRPKTFEISEAGTYYASISGKASGPYNLGLYGLRVMFAAAAAPPPAVPLPGAAWLLLGGLGVLGRHVRRRR